ncbi:WhiB family transcriptional regulator [Rhodococcus sp. 3A]|uniref:WhiB family transcriptional regulator n=1 Tax=Rhodococcus sp. 3A TaxID=2834581 RepID=UPI00163AC281|nr:WhiB family transcriptional regulator [Rhodococcus sp. 3A]MBC2897867.1 WhiB family transcriptional regulator [Rhodococcus sp. 4CII]
MVEDRSASDTGASWRDIAVCTQVHPDLFFPVKGDGTSRREDLRAAQSVCAGCPVWRQCLSEALAAGEQWGVWGGVNMEAIRTAKRRQRVKALLR